jgi:uncharacterized lipoprotein YmbA
MRRILFVAALTVIVASATGCRSPSSHFYTLTPAPAGGTAAAPLDIGVVVGPVSIPAIVDTPQIVVSTGPNTVAQDEFNRWASPLQNNIARVVAENLVAMLGTGRVTLLQDGGQAKSDYQVAIGVQGFESMPGEAATLNAVWTVRRVKDDKSKTGRSNLHEPAQQKGYDALVAAHSRALARLSQDIADAIRALDHGA